MTISSFTMCIRPTTVPKTNESIVCRRTSNAHTSMPFVSIEQVRIKEKLSRDENNNVLFPHHAHHVACRIILLILGLN